MDELDLPNLSKEIPFANYAVVFMNYIYPHCIWTRVCINGFFDHDSIPMTFYYTYFKGLSNVRLDYRYM